MTRAPDHVCLHHGLKNSEHELGFCLYCCLCFKELKFWECNRLPNGDLEDVCKPCAEQEAAVLAAGGLKRYNQTDGD